MGCVCCGAAAEIGALCRPCIQQVPPCDGLIPEHLHSTIDTTEAAAWVVDGFGAAHALAAKTSIGRRQDGELVILASSVSREHAELRKTDAGWHVRDLGSRNGTFVDGARALGRQPLGPRALVKIGDVALWFLADVAHDPLPPPSAVTASAGGGLVRYQLSHAGLQLCLVGTTEASAGGALLSRARDAEPWTERSLAPLEFQLLRALCARAVEEANAPSAVRGCVQTRQLARDLPFQSRYANEENVRQVVRRVRALFGELGVESVLAVSPGRGYYLACSILSVEMSR